MLPAIRAGAQGCLLKDIPPADLVQAVRDAYLGKTQLHSETEEGGKQPLTRNTPFLKYAGEAVMGFYILHQTVLLIIGYFVVRWNIADLAKWMVIFASSFVVIMVLYEFIVRRVNVLRFLCGMKPTPKVVALPRETVLARE